jgi:hypothetical protein
MIEFVFDTTRAVANLIYSGTLERYRNLSIILAHAGGTVPFVSWRIAQGDRIPALLEKAPRGRGRVSRAAVLRHGHVRESPCARLAARAGRSVPTSCSAATRRSCPSR